MSNEAELEAAFWKSIKSDMTVMLGLAERQHGHAQPMTAIVEEAARGPIWFFSARDVELVRATDSGAAAVIHYSSKGHDLFASVEGHLSPHNDRAVIDRLWNPFVAAWYEGGKDDPKLQLLRFEPESAQIWRNENSLFAGVRILLGRDPKKDYQDKVAEVRMA